MDDCPDGKKEPPAAPSDDVDDVGRGGDDAALVVTADPPPSQFARMMFGGGDSNTPGVSDAGPDASKCLPEPVPATTESAEKPTEVGDAGLEASGKGDAVQSVAPSSVAEGAAAVVGDDFGILAAAASAVNSRNSNVVDGGAQPNILPLSSSAASAQEASDPATKKVDDGVSAGGGKAETSKSESALSKVATDSSSVASVQGVDNSKAPAPFAAIKAPQFGAPASFSGGAFQSVSTPFSGFAAAFGKKAGHGPAKIPLFGPSSSATTQAKPAPLTGSFGFPTLATFGSGSPGSKPVAFSTPQSVSKPLLNPDATVFTPLAESSPAKVDVAKSADFGREISAPSVSSAPIPAKKPPKRSRGDTAAGGEKARIFDKQGLSTPDNDAACALPDSKIDGSDVDDSISHLNDTKKDAVEVTATEQQTTQVLQPQRQGAVASPTPVPDLPRVAPSDEKGLSAVEKQPVPVVNRVDGAKACSPEKGSDSTPTLHSSVHTRTPEVPVKASTQRIASEVSGAATDASSKSVIASKPSSGIVTGGEREILTLTGCNFFIIVLNSATGRRMLRKRSTGEMLRVVVGGKNGTGLELMEGGSLWQFLKVGKDCLSSVRGKRDNSLICTRIGKQKPEEDTPNTPEKFALTLPDEASLKSLVEALAEAEAAAVSASESALTSHMSSKGSSAASGKLSRDEDLKKKKLAALQSLRKKSRPKKGMKASKMSTPLVTAAADGEQAPAVTRGDDKQSIAGGESKDAPKVAKDSMSVEKVSTARPAKRPRPADTPAISSSETVPMTPRKEVPEMADVVAMHTEQAETPGAVEMTKSKPVAVGSAQALSDGIEKPSKPVSGSAAKSPFGVTKYVGTGAVGSGDVALPVESKDEHLLPAKEPMHTGDGAPKATEVAEDLPPLAEAGGGATLEKDADRTDVVGAITTGGSSGAEMTALASSTPVEAENDGVRYPGVGKKRSASTASVAQAAETKKVKFALPDEIEKHEALTSTASKVPAALQSGASASLISRTENVTPAATKSVKGTPSSKEVVAIEIEAPAPASASVASKFDAGSATGRVDLYQKKGEALKWKDVTAPVAVASKPSVPSKPSVTSKPIFSEGNARETELSTGIAAPTTLSTAGLEAERRAWESEKKGLLTQLSRIPELNERVQQLQQECAKAKEAAASAEVRASTLDSAMKEARAAGAAEAAKCTALSRSVQVVIDEARSLKNAYTSWLDSGAARVRRECRPASTEDFCERLDTFRPSSWAGFGEVGQICPVECAMHGWFNSGKNTLASTDGASLNFNAAVLTTAGVAPYRAEVARVRDAIVASGHAMLSGWVGASCPASFREFGSRRLSAAAVADNPDILRRRGVPGVLPAADAGASRD